MVPRTTPIVKGSGANLPPEIANSFRCIGCYGWSDKVHGIGVFVPFSDKPPIPYPVCKKCKNAILGGGDRARQVLEKAEAYLTERVVSQAKGVGE